MRVCVCACVLIAVCQRTSNLDHWHDGSHGGRLHHGVPRHGLQSASLGHALRRCVSIFIPIDSAESCNHLNDRTIAVGALIGFSVAASGWTSIQWKGVAFIVASWLVSPVCAGIVSLVLYVLTRSGILRSRQSYGRSLIFLPICFAFTLALNLYFVLEGVASDSFPWWAALLVAIGTGLLVRHVIIVGD